MFRAVYVVQNSTTEKGRAVRQAERKVHGGIVLTASVFVEEIASCRIMRFRKSEVDFSDCEEIISKFKHHGGEGSGDWVFNLNGLSFIDSEVIKTLLKLSRIVSERRGRASLVCNGRGHNRYVLRSLNLLRIGDCLVIYKDENEALTRS